MDFGDHEMVNSHNFHMALRWDHTAYYPPVIFPCLHAAKKEKMRWNYNNGHGDLFLCHLPSWIAFLSYAIWESTDGDLLLLERFRRRLHIQMMIQIRIITAIRHATTRATMINGVSGQSLWYHIKWPVNEKENFWCVSFPSSAILSSWYLNFPHKRLAFLIFQQPFATLADLLLNSHTVAV